MGAKSHSIVQGLVHGPVSQSARATEVVECGGGEAELEQCRHAHRGEGEVECKLDQDIVAVSCVYDSLAACKPRSEHVVPHLIMCMCTDEGLAMATRLSITL